RAQRPGERLEVGDEQVGLLHGREVAAAPTPPPPPPPGHGYPAQPAYGQHYGYHGHYRRKKHHGFLGELFD
ncbi:hypothetical protein DLJ46_01510, partial [Micromonospora globispora]